MKCPLDFPVVVRVDKGTELRGGDCLKEECAWWDEGRNRCAVLTVAEQLVGIGWSLSYIEHKLQGHERLV